MQQQDDDDTTSTKAEPTVDPETRACMRWGIASIVLGGLVFVVLYTSIANGADVHPELSRAATTGAVGALISGLMLILAAKIMQHVDRVGASRTASAKRIEATETQIAETQTLMAEELVGIHSALRELLKSSGRSVAEWDEKIETLHDEINRDIANALLGRLHPDGSVVEMRPRRT